MTKKHFYKPFFLGAMLSVSIVSVQAQPAVHVGKGSYAAYAPLSKSRSNEHGGDQSRYMQFRKLNIREEAGRPIPTNDWWTNMMNADDKHVGQELTGHLWSYPQFVQGMKYGVDVQYPKYWIDNGTEMKAQSKLTVKGEDFSPTHPMVETWSDWAMTFSEEDGKQRMLATLVHGVPFTWIETQGISPIVSAEKTNNGDSDNLLKDQVSMSFTDAEGETLAGTHSLTQFVVKVANTQSADLYGVYLPEGTEVVIDGGCANIRYTNQQQFLVVALLNETSDLETFADYAYSKPTSTEVSWDYDETAGRLTTHWTVTATDLRTGSSTDKVMQGFLPHLYRNGATPSFSFTDTHYLTPHGQLKMAEGAQLDVAYRFYGILPWYGLPLDDGENGLNGFLGVDGHPYRKERMMELLKNYAAEGSFGADTYWGGKGLTQMALYMSFAREMGELELFRQCRDRLKAAMVNWLTYTPGESNTFFARDNRYGGLIGYDTSYDSDTYNDHHFHYGYYTLAGAMLALVDDDFRNNYGEMLRLIAKDYANWERDEWSCFFRTFDPWGGHSFAGGMGDGNGNGQESTSEAMQGWGGLYLLGVALDDKAMRNAGIFGWVSEARGTAEYWFDRHGDTIDSNFHQSEDTEYNINYQKLRNYNADGTLKYVVPYNSNYTCHGVGWWTYFSGDPVWMAGIQWMPISPALDYLSEDKEFAAWDFQKMWNIKEIGGWYEQGTHTIIRDGEETTENTGCLGDESGIGNVVLAYLQRSNPEEAAAVFDNLWDAGKGLAKNTDTGGITYFITHSHLTYGDIDWTVNGSVPTARAYQKNSIMTYMGYNPTDEPLDIHFYKDGVKVYTLDRVPARQLRVSGVESIAVTEIAQESTEEADAREELAMVNLALGKTCTESSHENVGTVPENATDGNLDTRWGSEHSDDQWLEVDLEQVAYIYKVRIHWEAAFASEYKLQLYDSNHKLTHEQTVSNGNNGWVETMMGDKEGRYVRIQGLKRATNYGYSLHELEVYGKTAAMTDDDILGVKISCEDEMLKQGRPSQLHIQGYTCRGEWTEVTPTWSSTDGVVTAKGVFTPNVYGTATVTAKVGGMTATKALPVEEAIRITSLTIEPTELHVVLGESANYEVAKKDQFGVTIERETRTYEATEVGLFDVAIEEDGCRDTLKVVVYRFEDMNLALKGKASWSSAIGDSDGSRINDGDAGSRWESQWQSDEEWVQIDLCGIFKINRLVLRWEAAFAKAYSIEVSTDGEEWTEVYSTKASQGGMEDLTITPTAARQVRILCQKRALEAYGYSLYELEVYGTETIVPVSIEDLTDNGHLTPGSMVYDLTGRRVAPLSAYTLLKRGTYIVNGKKIYKP